MHNETLKRIEELIRKGAGKAAQAELKAISQGKPPREVLSALASQARRAGMPELGVRLLNPIVRPPPRSPKRATDAEIVEYAGCLIRVGASNEALKLLQNIDARKNPQAFLYRSHGLFTQWRSIEAVPALQCYLKEVRGDEYQRIVGQVNLAAALLDGRYLKDTEEILEVTRKQALEKGYTLLFANCLELSAQVALLQKKWRPAEKFINEAASLLKDQGAVDELFVLKWRAVLALMKRPGKRELKDLNRVRKIALRAGHWETLRECDLFQACATGNEKLLLHVYFGTPFESYRKRIFLEFSRPLTVPESYLWQLGPKAGGKHWEPYGKERKLKPGQLLFRTLSALTSDFYRPQRMGALHALIYPEEFFNPISSPMRVHQAVRRLRVWFRQKRVPLEIEERSGSYYLSSAAGCGVLLPRHLPAESLLDARLKILRWKWGEEFFSAAHAQKVLKTSSRTTLRLLQAAVEDGQIARFGASSACRYRFPPARE